MTSAECDILLSVTMLRPDEKLLLHALRARGVRVRPVLQEDLAELAAGRTALPRLSMIRNLSHREAVGVARRLETLGTRTLNQSGAIELCNDKGLQALLFARHDIPHPVTRHAYSYSHVREAATELGWPAVLKPVSGSWGRGVTKLVDEECVEAWVGGRESTDAGGKLFPVLIQEYVDKPGYDLRVVVVGRTPIVAIRRASADWRTNTHLGAEVERVEMTAEIGTLCARLAGVLGDGFYGVDLLEDRHDGELKVLEVNANPEFARSAAIHGVDVAGHLAAYVVERLAMASSQRPPGNGKV
jgi:[lysine-biosynthesis-protein LysW]--L-2-aminoadipate ligase